MAAVTRDSRFAAHSTDGACDDPRPAAIRYLPAADAQGRSRPDAGAAPRPRAHGMARPSRLPRGLDRRAPLGGLGAHRQPRGVHRRGRAADQPHQARHRRQLAALSPPDDPGRPDRDARSPHPWAHDVRRGPGPAHLRRRHVGHRPQPPAAADGRVVRCHHAAVRRRDRHQAHRLVRLRGGRPADAAVLGLRRGRRIVDVAVGFEARRPLRHGHVVHRRHRTRRVRGARLQLQRLAGRGRPATVTSPTGRSGG